MKKRPAVFIILAFILLFAAVIRASTFYLPHNHGDQIVYLALAMKIDQSGFKDYNLLHTEAITNDYYVGVVKIPALKGKLLEFAERDHVFHYSYNDLSYIAPAYSCLLMLSHRLFDPHGLYQAVKFNLGAKALLERPIAFFKAQFYAVWINFVFSLLFIFLVFLLGRAMFSRNIGLWAAFFIAICPVDILTAQRVWVDEMLAVLAALSVLFYWQARKEDSSILMLLSALCAGIATLTKQSGFFIIAAIVISDYLIRMKQIKAKKDIWRWMFEKKIIFFILISFLIASIWYTRVSLVYKTHWWYWPQPGPQAALPRWEILLSRRPRISELYYFIYLVPIFAFFYLEMLRTVIKKMFSDERILCCVWFLVFALILVATSRKEERYLLAAYPAIAILTGAAMESIRTRFSSNNGLANYLGDITVGILLVLTGVWSVYIGLSFAFNNAAIIVL